MIKFIDTYFQPTLTRFVFLCILLLNIFSTSNAQIPTTGLVGDYPFNGNTNDESSYLNHGLNSGATLTTNRFGQADSAYQFNGINQYIEIPDGNQLSISSTNSLTISVWMRSDVLDFINHTSDYVHWMGKGVSSQHEWVLRIYNLNSARPNRTTCYVFNLSGGLGAGSYVEETISIGEWIHIVAVYDYQNDIVKLYKNGVLKDTEPFSNWSITPGNGTAPVRIGTRNFNTYYEGAIDDLRFYNRVLTIPEINQLYNEVGCSTFTVASSQNICQGDSILLYGTYQNTTGIYYDSLQTINGCDSILSTTITVNSLPSVSLTNFNPDTLCVNVNLTPLPVATPSGGFYSGNGVIGNNFNPSTAGVGTHNIIYTYTDGNSCINSDTTIVTVDICTGIDYVSTDFGILIYPNPSTGQFTIEKSNDLNKEVQIKLLDANSKLILEKVIPIGQQKIDMDIRNYSKGIYYLHLIVDDKQFVKQILKN